MAGVIVTVTKIPGGVFEGLIGWESGVMGEGCGPDQGRDTNFGG